MNRSILLVFLALASLAAKPAIAAWTRDPSTNEPVCVAADNQNHPEVASDAAGNTFITWHDFRSGDYDIYVQKYSPKGVPLWGTNGVRVPTNLSLQSYPQIVADGAGGAIVAWTDLSTGTDYDIYAQRLNSSGVPIWAVQGVLVCAELGNQWHLTVAPDGLGGMLLAWTDLRNGDSDVYAQRMSSAGAGLWGANGVALTTASDTQELPEIVADGSGGVIACWTSTGNLIYAQRVNAAGVPQWTANGVLVSGGNSWSQGITTDGAGGAIIGFLYLSFQGSIEGAWAVRLNSSGQKVWATVPEDPGVALMKLQGSVQFTLDRLEITSDGTGGAIAIWSDRRNGSNNRDLFARKVSGAGVAQWTNHGVAVCTALNNQEGWIRIITDGSGGAIATWHDQRVDNVTIDAYAQRLDANGVGQWGISGALVSAAASNQSNATLAPDARGGAVIAWHDLRTGVYDIRAQHIDRYGFYGDPSPEIAWVHDVPNDQGERVRIRWNASYRDTFPTLNVGMYGIWRQVTESAAASALARGARVSRAGDAREAMPGNFRVERTSVQTTWWEGVGSIPARGEPWYTFAAETFQDSTTAGNPLTTFMVDAHDANVPLFWSSFSETGYSVDNLPPAIPGAFAAQYQGGATQLTWSPNVENDLAAYQLYRGATADFVPSIANRIAAPTTPAYSDPSPTGSYYKLSATDIHGNESGIAVLTGSTDVAGDLPLQLALHNPSPNPARASAAIHFALPQAGHLSLSIYDASGRRVRLLVRGVHPPGEDAVPWDLRDDRGAAVAGGLYFVRLEAGGQSLTRRIAAIR